MNLRALAGVGDGVVRQVAEDGVDHRGVAPELEVLGQVVDHRHLLQFEFEGHLVDDAAHQGREVHFLLFDRARTRDFVECRDVLHQGVEALRLRVAALQEVRHLLVGDVALGARVDDGLQVAEHRGDGRLEFVGDVVAQFVFILVVLLFELQFCLQFLVVEFRLAHTARHVVEEDDQDERDEDGRVEVAVVARERLLQVRVVGEGAAHNAVAEASGRVEIVVAQRFRLAHHGVALARGKCLLELAARHVVDVLLSRHRVRRLIEHIALQVRDREAYFRAWRQPVVRWGRSAVARKRVPDAGVDRRVVVQRVDQLVVVLQAGLEQVDVVVLLAVSDVRSQQRDKEDEENNHARQQFVMI